MTLNEREAFEEQFKTTEIYKREQSIRQGDILVYSKTLKGYFNIMVNDAWQLWQKAKAQAVPDNSILVPRTREIVVAIEKMVEQQVEASGITSDVFRLDGWRILDAIEEASESGAEG